MKFTAVNTIKNSGKTYFPGADIELDPKSKTAENLLSAGAIKHYDPAYAKEYQESKKPAQQYQDDLTEIKGVGQELQYALNNVGIRNFNQLAAAQPENLAKLPGITEKKAKAYQAEAKRILSRRKK